MSNSLNRTAILLAMFLSITALASISRAEVKDLQYDNIRAELKSQYLVQSILDWYVRTNGERSIMEETYRGREALYSKKNIQHLDKLLRDKKLTTDDRRAVQFLKNALTLEYIGLDTAHFGDEISNAETSATVSIDWIAEPVPYKQLFPMLSKEQDPERRKVLQAAQAGVWRDKLNPIYAKQEERVRQLVRELGYTDYVKLAEIVRNVDVADLLSMSMSYYSKSDPVYKRLLENEIGEAMGIPVSQFSRADISYLASVPHLKKFFPPQLAVPSFKYFLEGMNLDLTTIAGTPILIDDEPRDKKEPRAACYSISVPDDIRMTLKPSGGVDDFATLFHESGHALHFGNTTETQWEFQQLGNNAVTEGFAIFFESMWGEYDWLVKYRELVKSYNRFAAPADQVPVMTDREIGLLIRNRVFWDMYMMRRYNSAKLIYETILHGGLPAIYKDFFKGQTDDLQQVYKTVFSDAYGFPLTDQDALRFRTDVDSFFYAADYSRAFLLSAQLTEGMKRKFGARWFDDPKAGAYIRTLWAGGGKMQADELSKMIGETKVDFSAFAERNSKRLEIAGKLIDSGK